MITVITIHTGQNAIIVIVPIRTPVLVLESVAIFLELLGTLVDLVPYPIAIHIVRTRSPGECQAATHHGVTNTP